MEIKTNTSIWILTVMILCVCRSVQGSPNAENILKSTDRNDGLCVLINVSDPDLAISIAQKSKFVVHVLHEDADAVAAMRKAIDARGLYGRVSVQHAALVQLPYAENLVNLIVVTGYKLQVTSEELERVLAPLGVAVVADKNLIPSTINHQPARNATHSVAGGPSTIGKWFAFSKPFPPSMDEWTHDRHNAEGNTVAEDMLVGPPRHVRWVADPIFQRAHNMTPGTTTMVTSGGRIFYIQDDSPIGFAGLPDQWRLIARDAFNGKLLWKQDMGPWGEHAWSWWAGSHQSRGNRPMHVPKRLVANKDMVFITLDYNAPVSVLDAATGETLRQLKGTEYADELIFKNGILYVSVNDRPQEPLPGKGFFSKPTSNNPSEKTVWAIQPDTGEVIWKAGPFAGLGSGAGKTRMSSMVSIMLLACEEGVFLADKDSIIGLDLKTGKEKFRYSPVAISGKDSMIYHKGSLIIGSKSLLTAIDVKSGKKRWANEYAPLDNKNTPEFFAIGDLVWANNRRSMEALAFDLVTGQEKKKLSLKEILVDAGHHQRCYPNKSTVRYMITSRRAAEFLDYETGEVTLNHWARGQCRYGLMPANGLLYKLPDPCTCHMEAKLLGFYALASAEQTQTMDHGLQTIDHRRLEEGKAYGKLDNSTTQQPNNPTTASSWPQFRHDALRSSSVKTEIPDQIKMLWDVKIAEKITPPVIAGGRVYVSAVDQHKIYALDAAAGRKVWTYIAGGPVDSPPSIYKGTVIFGSVDGWVYCLRAEDGRLAWRFRAAPYERNIMAYNQIESVWPVHGSVMVANGVVYCAAGRSSFVDGGIYLYALDASTGEVLGKNVIHDIQTKNGGGAKKMPDHAPGAASNILVTDGERIYSRSREFVFGVPVQKGPEDYLFPAEDYLDVPSSFFDQQWFHRLKWRYGKSAGNMIAFDEHTSCSVSALKMQGGQHLLYVPRGGDITKIPNQSTLPEGTGLNHVCEIEEPGFLLRKRGASSWEDKAFPVCPVSMVLAGKKLLIAGFMDEIDPEDPWANIEGHGKSVLRLLSKEDGKKLAEYKLETNPVWNGMAAANEKVFISLKNGKVICLGK